MENIITDIYWNGTVLFIEYEADSSIGLMLRCENRVYITEEEKIGENKYRAKINTILAHKERNPLPGGIYRFVILGFDDETENDNFIEIPAANKVLLKSHDLSRLFRYGGKSYAYTVSFDVREDNEKEKVYIRPFFSFMRKNNHPKMRRPLFESDKASVKVKYSFGLVLRKLSSLCYNICKILIPLKGNKILFMSENRFSISENLEAIDKRLKERNFDKDFKISYSFRNIFDKKYSILSSLKLVIKIASSDYIFIDDYTPILALFNLRKGTSLVQTWHAGVGFKTVGYARFGIDGSPHPYHSCHREYTYGLVGCETLKEIYSEVWGIPKSSLIASGMPRLDHFLDDDIIKTESERLYNKYPQIKNKKVLLFAPTYRGTTQKDAYYDFEKLDFEKLYDFCKENNTVILFKMHHFIKEPVPIKDSMRDLFIEITDEKINSLYYISDVLITDYSSCFYDYSLLKKPILFYLYDKDLYTATRGVQRPIEDVAPGKICQSFDEMLKALKNEDFETYKLDKFYMDQNINKEKMASDIVIDTVILKNRG